MVTSSTLKRLSPLGWAGVVKGALLGANTLLALSQLGGGSGHYGSGQRMWPGGPMHLFFLQRLVGEGNPLESPPLHRCAVRTLGPLPKITFLVIPDRLAPCGPRVRACGT